MTWFTLLVQILGSRGVVGVGRVHTQSSWSRGEASSVLQQCLRQVDLGLTSLPG